MVQEICNKETESYAKEILNWPNGRLAKSDIFSPVDEGTFEDLGECTKHFVKYLRDLYELSPPKHIPIYPHAFIAVSNDEAPRNATLVLAYKVRGLWQLEHRSVPVKVDLGQSVDGLRMGDETAMDLLDRYASDGKTDTTEQRHGNSDCRPTDKWAFAVFSTGLLSALSLPALIDPSTDEVQPSEATLDLVGDPETSHFQMPWERMKELFPVICRDDERREEKVVLVMQLEWDGNTEKDDQELKDVGKAAKVHGTRVGVKEALARARGITE